MQNFCNLPAHHTQRKEADQEAHSSYIVHPKQNILRKVLLYLAKTTETEGRWVNGESYSVQNFVFSCDCLLIFPRIPPHCMFFFLF
jgi:hypothetical protein